MNIFLIAIGGALGAVLRYGLSRLVNSFTGTPDVITGTVAANVLGCFLAGILLAFATSSGIHGNLLLFLSVGFLGSLTTFSTFSLEAWRMFEQSLTSILKYLFLLIIVVIGMTVIGYGVTAWLMN